MSGGPRQYAALSGSYDGLMWDGDYPARAAFFGDILRESSIPVETVLDLGCGTGTITWLLYRQGFRMIAADNSEEMLTEAIRKGDAMREAIRKGDATREAIRKGDAAREAICKGDATPTDAPDIPEPLFICQSMPRLKLAAPVDGVISTFDSLNYLTRERDLRETFRRVARYLTPGGRFLFDVNTPYRFRMMNRQTYLDETEESFCAWRTFFSEKRQVCVWQVDLFRRRPDGAWERSFEEHRERAWSMEQLREFLRDAGFSRVEITGDLSRKPPKESETRWFVLAEKVESI